MRAFLIASSLTMLVSCGNPLVTNHEPPLSKDEVLNYLQGRPLLLPEGTVTSPGAGMKVPEGTNIVHSNATHQPIDVKTQTITMQTANISNLQIGKTVQPATEVPYMTPVTFIYNHGGEHFAVEATIDHRMTAGQRAFFGFEIIRIAKQ